MTRLSINAAWDAGNAFLRREMALVAPVVLLFMALPEAVTTILVPDAAPGQTPPGYVLLTLVAKFVQVFGTVALVILALRSGISVAEALRAARVRLPAAVGTLAILLLAMILICLPLLPYLDIGTGGVRKDVPPGILLYMIGAIAVLVGLGVRLSLANIVVAAEEVGPVGAFRRSVALTRGVAFRIAVFVLGFSLFMLIVLLAISAGLGAVLIGIGKIGGFAMAATVVGKLVAAVASAALSAWLMVLLAMIYRQLAGSSSGI